MKNVTTIDNGNATQVEAMMAKAVHAYANAIDSKKARARLRGNHSSSAYVKRSELEVREASCMGEYEATVKCIAMFVNESVPEIRRIVIGEYKKEMAR